MIQPKATGPVIGIDAIAPPKTTDEAQFQEQDEVIDILLNAFKENFRAFKENKMKDEVNYILFSSPGPSQYAAFEGFFDHLEGGEEQISDLKKYMYMHDFAAMDNATKPAILGLLQNLISIYKSESDSSKDKRVTMVSGSFWAHHIPTRKKIILLFEQLHEMKAKLRIVTRASRTEPYIEDLVSLLGRDSRFSIPNRVPIHFVRAGDDFLFFEFPHTESSVVRLNMLLDLNALRYKQGKTKADLLNFLDGVIKKGL
jgi:thiol-disulfide isomerase/thioredoxin